MNALVSKRQEDAVLALIRRTVASDCNAPEFDQFVHICKHTGLDPIRRQIYCFVFSKNDADKRKMTVVTGIDGYRAISARSTDYRPADKPATIEYSADAKDPNTNPLGIVRAEVTLYKFAHGDWHAVVGEAYWDEFAPIVQDGEGGSKWEEVPGKVHPEGHKHAGKPVLKRVPIGDVVPRLDPAKTGWIKSPRNQLAKCAEAQAHRKGWPNDHAGLYVAEEIDRSHTINLTASEMADEGDRVSRLQLIGGGKAVMIDWMDGEALQRVAVGQFYDQAMAFIAGKMKPGEEEAGQVRAWAQRNKHSLQDFWAYEKDAALALKKEIERIEAIAKGAAAASPAK